MPKTPTGGTNDRNRKKSGKTPSGNHPASNANGKVRAAAGDNRREKRTSPKGKGEEKTVEEALPPKPKPKLPAAAKVTDDALLIERAHEWARLHSNPRTRDKMDVVLNGLNERDKRRVRLCGQRIASGLSVKLINE